MDPVNIHIDEIVTDRGADQAGVARAVAGALAGRPGVPGVVLDPEVTRAVARSVLTAISQAETR